MNMADPEASSIEWFVMYMRLHNHGVIPDVTPSEFMPTRPQVADFMGPKQGSGYAFNNHGSPEYEEYVRELLVRVLQVNWPVNNIVPFHFARGLTSEARGTEVNWAQFAFKATHPHQSRSGIPRVIEAYAELQAPLHPLSKVIPPPNSGSIRLDRYFNRQRFHLPQTRINRTPATLVDPVVEDADATTTPRSAPAGNPRIRYARRADVSVNLEVGEQSARKSSKASTGRLGSSENGVINIVPALCALRPGIIQLVEAEQRRLQETRNMAYAKLTSGETRYREEKEKAQQILTKIEEKLGFQRRAVHEYERARRVLVTAIINVGNGIAVDGKVPPNNMIYNSESLVNSWYENVRIARHRLQEWELKSERQGVIVGRLNEELKQAENEYRNICESLDVQLAQLKAITDLLDDVKT